MLAVPAAGIYTHSADQLEEAGKYLEEKRSALKGVKIVTELEPIKMYYKAEVSEARGDTLQGRVGVRDTTFAIGEVGMTKRAGGRMAGLAYERVDVRWGNGQQPLRQGST